MSITWWMPGLLPLLLSTALAMYPTDPRRLRPRVLRGYVVLPGLILFLPGGLNDSPVPRWTAPSLVPLFTDPLPTRPVEPSLRLMNGLIH